jgi:hypothetical protein
VFRRSFGENGRTVSIIGLRIACELLDRGMRWQMSVQVWAARGGRLIVVSNIASDYDFAAPTETPPQCDPAISLSRSEARISEEATRKRVGATRRTSLGRRISKPAKGQELSDGPKSSPAKSCDARACYRQRNLGRSRVSPEQRGTRGFLAFDLDVTFETRPLRWHTFRRCRSPVLDIKMKVAGTLLS